MRDDQVSEQPGGNGCDKGGCKNTEAAGVPLLGVLDPFVVAEWAASGAGCFFPAGLWRGFEAWPFHVATGA
jgi:hypothetical protein